MAFKILGKKATTTNGKKGGKKSKGKSKGGDPYHGPNGMEVKHDPIQVKSKAKRPEWIADPVTASNGSIRCQITLPSGESIGIGGFAQLWGYEGGRGTAGILKFLHDYGIPQRAASIRQRIGAGASQKESGHVRERPVGYGPIPKVTEKDHKFVRRVAQEWNGKVE